MQTDHVIADNTEYRLCRRVGAQRPPQTEKYDSVNRQKPRASGHWNTNTTAENTENQTKCNPERC